MKTNNKGIALVYTVLTMLLVFAICMLITTLMIAQITYYTSYEEKSESKYLYSQIGDIFFRSDGNFYCSENGETANDDERARSTAFCKLLSEKYDVSSLRVVVDRFVDENDINVTWEGVKCDKTALTFELYKLENDITLVVLDRANGRRAMLKVTLRLSEGNTQIVEWNRGDE